MASTGVLLRWLCLVAGAILLLRPHGCSAKLHGNDINVYEDDLNDESNRARLFMERHGTWPDPKWLEWEKPGYTAMMDEKARKLMTITDREARWSAWKDLSQARMVPRLTENQWDVVDAPEHINRRLLENFHRLLPEAGIEADMQAIQGGIPKFLPQEDLNYEVLHEMTPFFEKWAGMKLEPTSVYGVRLYQEGQTLDDHLDIIETHVISGILHIDSDLDEPFPVQIDNSDGTLASMNLKPGQVMFYESAKSFHQRMVPMKGRYYGSIFMHYRPVDWNITRRDVKIAVPPYWADGLDGSGAKAEQAPEEPPPKPKGAQGIHGDKLDVYEDDLNDETNRARLFHEVHGSWPDPKWLEWEKPGYTEMMDEKARKAMAITDRHERWLTWRDLSQARMVPRFTENQWDVVDAPEHINRRLLENFHRLLPEASAEADNQGAVFGGLPKFLPQEDLNYEVLHEMTPFFEKWAGMKLEPTSVYGVRLYQEGQTLKDHLDIIETHVISGILHIDSDLDEPFPVQIDNSDGTLASMNLKPGQVMFYESAKSFHQRNVPMKGRYYGSIFMHYRPVGWNMTRRDVKIAIPPYWKDGLDDPEIMASIENNGDSPVVINWVIPGSEKTSADGQPQMSPIETLQPGRTTRIKTLAGHTLFAIRPDGSYTKWTVEQKHRTSVLRVVEESHGHDEL